MATTTTAPRPTSQQLQQQRSDMSDHLQQQPHDSDGVSRAPPAAPAEKLLPLDSIERPHPPPAPAAASSSSSASLKQQQHEQLVLTMAATSSDSTKEKDMDDGDKALYCEGYLRKRYSTSVYMGSWRYCIVQGSRLRWYMTEELARQDSQLRGEVWVRAVEPWTGQGSVNTYPHAFAIRTVSNRVLLCSAKSREDKDAWLACLQRGVQQRNSFKRTPSGVATAANAAGSDAHDRSSHMHENRRIVPEDMLRHASDTAFTPPVSSESAVTSAATAASSGALVTLSDMACARCAIRFGAVLARRCVCSSCAKAFCSRHCAHSVTLSHLGLRTARRCCYACARRQEFIVYLASLERFLQTVSAHCGSIDAAIRRPQLDTKSASPAVASAAELLERTLCKLRSAPMSLIKTIKILYQTRRKPLLFRAACERLPFYVEHCIDRVENLWYQLLHLFQCCDAEGDSASVQLFDLRRYIRAICRRSPRIALQTIWHVQASAGDANGLHPHSLLALLGFVYPSLSNNDSDDDASATTWKELLLAQCPDHQRRAILRSLRHAYAQSELLIAREPETRLTRWLNATTVSEFEASARELAASGIELCEFQTSILYESLRFGRGEWGASPAEDTAAPVTSSASGSTPLEALVFDQVNFVQSLAAISERLRHVLPVEQRGARLEHELAALNDTLQHSALYPLCTASDELFRVLRIPPAEGKVFSTKMRAPTLIFLETVPVTATTLVGSDDDERLRPFISSSRRRSLTFLDALAPPSLAILGDGASRASLVSSNESSTDAILGGGGSGLNTLAAAGVSVRCGSHTSLYDDTESLGHSETALDDHAAVQSSTLSTILGRHMTFPGASGGAGRKERTPATAPAPPAVDAGESRGFSLVSLSHKRHSVDNLVYDCKVYGESWDERRERIRRESPFGHLAGWQLFSVIVKTNDDLRQEVFTMQLMEKFRSIFEYERVPLWLRTYRIVATGANIGLLETITDACSLDHLKKNCPGGDLVAYFHNTFGIAESPTFEAARSNFIASMAAYSVVCYLLLVKDRHNGNILLSTEGHIIHIDFGFILGIAPGGRFSIEDAPFKLTVEMVDVMGGLESAGFARFRRLMCDALVALQKYHSEIAALLQTTGQHSPFPCFQGAKLAKVITDLRGRLCVGLTRQQVARRVDTLIRKSYNVWGTRQYDAFQQRSNNIHP